MLAVEPILILLTAYMALVYGVSQHFVFPITCFNTGRFYIYSSKRIRSVSKKVEDGLKDWGPYRFLESQLGSS